MAGLLITRRLFGAAFALVAAETASARQRKLLNGIYLVVGAERDDATWVPYRTRDDFEVVGNGRLMALNVAAAHAEFDKNIGLPVVLVVLTGEGREQFSRITTEYTGVRLAVIIDGFVVSAPTIVEPISGGQFQISSSITLEEATDLARRLLSAEAE
jgi:preprotein translocase subunit SecD